MRSETACAACLLAFKVFAQRLESVRFLQSPLNLLVHSLHFLLLDAGLLFIHLVECVTGQSRRVETGSAVCNWRSQTVLGLGLLQICDGRQSTRSDNALAGRRRCLVAGG